MTLVEMRYFCARFYLSELLLFLSRADEKNKEKWRATSHLSAQYTDQERGDVIFDFIVGSVILSDGNSLLYRYFELSFFFLCTSIFLSYRKCVKRKFAAHLNTPVIGPIF